MADYTDEENASTGEVQSPSPNGLVSKGASKVKSGIKKAGQAIKKEIGKAIKELVKALLRTPHGWIILLVIIGILILIASIVVVVLAISSNSNATVAANKYVSAGGSSKKSISESKDENGNVLYSAEEKQNAYKNSKSLLTFSVSEITDMAENMMKDDDDTAKIEDFKMQLKDDNSKRGKVNLNDDTNITLPSHQKTFLQHILSAEKYNFNFINWVKYDGSNEGTTMSSDDMATNKDLGLMYPKNADLKVMISSLLPYLQSWKIPLAMYCGEITGGTKDNSKSGRNVQLAWQILLEAYSDITVNQYEMQTLTRNYTRDDVKTVQCENEMKQVTTSAIRPDPSIGVITAVPDYATRKDSDIPDTVEYQMGNSEVCYDSTETTTYGTEKQNGSDTIESKYEYRIAEALTYDLMVKNSYVYKKYDTSETPVYYNESVASTSATEIYSNGTKIDINNSSTASSLFSSGTDKSSTTGKIPNGRKYKNSAGKDLSQEGYNEVTTVTRTVKYSKQTTVTNTIIKKWKDTLTSGEAKSNQYTYSDLLKFVKDKKDAGYETKGYQEKDGKGSMTKSSVYKELENKKELNRIDFINAVSGIYNKYTTKAAYDGIGIIRGNLYFSYYNLKESFKEIDKEGKYPYVYGVSLGIKNIATTKKYISSQAVDIPEGGFMWPVSNTTVGYLYGYTIAYGNFHEGIDLWNGSDNGESNDSRSKDTKVLAAQDGTVTSIRNDVSAEGDESLGYGNYIIIDHGNGFSTLYAHLIFDGGILVNVGDEVKMGQQIAWMGSTGYSTGKHLHFEIRKDNNRLDPLDFYNVVRINDESITYDEDKANDTIQGNSAAQYKYVSSKGNKNNKENSNNSDKNNNKGEETEIKYTENKESKDLRNPDSATANTLKNGLKQTYWYREAGKFVDYEDDNKNKKTLYALEYYKQNNAELMARHAAEELGISEKDEISTVYKYAAIAQMIQTYYACQNFLGYTPSSNGNDAVYKMFTTTGYMYMMASSGYDTFNSKPPAWLLQIAKDFIEHKEKQKTNPSLTFKDYPPGLPKDNASAWNGVQTLSIWDTVGRFNGLNSEKLKEQVVAYYYYNSRLNQYVLALYARQSDTRRAIMLMDHSSECSTRPTTHTDVDRQRDALDIKKASKIIYSSADRPYVTSINGEDGYEYGNVYLVGKEYGTYNGAAGYTDKIFIPN